MKAIIVLGADRVGKSTLVANTVRAAQAGGLSVLDCHFSEIKPDHHSPVWQFDKALDLCANDLPDLFLADRFVSDTLFYETYRSQMAPIPAEFAKTIESKLLSLATDGIWIVLLEHYWDGRLADRHTQEILNSNPDCTPYWVSKQVDMRRAEHEAYYQHTKEYLTNTSLIGKSIGYRVLTEGDIYRPSVSLLDWCS